MQKENVSQWYASWFDTPYYHILYKDRGHEEAEAFMKRLTTFLKLEKGNHILDLACGKGRHSISLNNMGFTVTGIDLSAASIAYAKQYETETLKFGVHDMCVPYPQQFDAVFDLFTSFGYFEEEEDNLRTVRAIKKELKANGHGVIDFMNSDFIIKNLVPEEIKTVQGITFHIKRYVENGYIFKEICFQDNDTPFTFVERVKALTLSDFKKYFEQADVTLEHCFGDYKLAPFHQETSERLILIFS